MRTLTPKTFKRWDKLLDSPKEYLSVYTEDDIKAMNKRTARMKKELKCEYMFAGDPVFVGETDNEEILDVLRINGF